MRVILLMCWISSCINVLFYTGIGLCALWLNSIRTLAMAFERLAFIFGGAILIIVGVIFVTLPYVCLRMACLHHLQFWYQVPSYP